ncbi:MAG: hypothetical protein QME51_10900, partial [Planctomycetota bacterium]|nr:hypothetical protein [Planctomycetota bacterium]
MIYIIRIQSQGQPNLLWQEVLRQSDNLQDALGTKGRMLYLSKRHKYNEASLVIHAADPDIVGCFVANHLAKLKGVDGIWIINLLKPVFHLLPENSGTMKRYTVT